MDAADKLSDAACARSELQVYASCRIATKAYPKPGRGICVHELSIAQAIVDGVQETVDREKATRVLRVRLRIGQLSGVVPDSLRFCYDLVVAGTCMEASLLEIVELPLVIHCTSCRADRVLNCIQLFACPVCGTPSGDIRQGRELEIESIEIDGPEGAPPSDAVESIHGSPNR